MLKNKVENMRNKIIKILRYFETGKLNRDKFQTSRYGSMDDPDNWHYEDCLNIQKEKVRNRLLKYPLYNLSHDEGLYNVLAYVKIPDTDYVLYEMDIVSEQEGHVRSELVRMERDGLIFVGKQTGQKFVLEVRGEFSNNTQGDGWDFETDSIVLTTKGKSSAGYLWHQVQEQPFAFVAICVSLLSLAISVYFNIPNV